MSPMPPGLFWTGKHNTEIRDAGVVLPSHEGVKEYVRRMW